MSLRYKALIAVVVLVAFLTGFLVVTSSTLFEEDARKRINKELEKDQRILDERITFAAQISKQGMRASAAAQPLLEFITDARYGDFTDTHLGRFAQDWRKDAGGDIAIFAFDIFTAEDRNAQVLGKVSDDLLYVCLNAETKIDSDALLTDPELR